MFMWRYRKGLRNAIEMAEIVQRSVMKNNVGGRIRGRALGILAREVIEHDRKCAEIMRQRVAS